VSSIDETALQKLIDSHGGALALYARQWCRNPEDAVQEAFIEFVRQAAVPESPAAWLYTTVRRRAMNLGRAEQRREKHHRRAGEIGIPWFLPNHDELDRPLEIQQLLTRLSDRDREIIVLRIWGGLTFEQIAELVGPSSSTVHRRYQQTLATLGHMLEETVTVRKDHETNTTYPRSS
jgi:RNA polymerase sigma factor (sigma-70 family)